MALHKWIVINMNFVGKSEETESNRVDTVRRGFDHRTA